MSSAGAAPSVMALPALATPAGLLRAPRAAARITSSYLALGLVPLTVGVVHDGLTIATGAVLMLHFGALAIAVVAGIRPNGRWQQLADFLPLAMIPLLYAELPYLIGGWGSGFRDAVVQRWELQVFGGHLSRTLAGLPAATWVSEPLHAAYLSYYAMIYAPLLYLYTRSSREGFRECVAAVMLTFVICFAAFVVFPVQGPRYLWSPSPAMPDGPFRRLAVAVLEGGSSRGAAFPSSHMAVAVVQAFMAVRWRVPGAVVICAAAALLGVGAVYGGFHYAIDMAAGALLGCAVALFAAYPVSPAGRTRREAAPGRWRSVPGRPPSR